MVGGVRALRAAALVTSSAAKDLETLRVGGRERVLNLRQKTRRPRRRHDHPRRGRQAPDRALKNLKELAREGRDSAARRCRPCSPAPTTEVRWGLALDELEPTGLELRPRVPLHGHTGPPAPRSSPPPRPSRSRRSSARSNSTRLTVADDAPWLEAIDAERNLPEWVAPGLRELYGA